MAARLYATSTDAWPDGDAPDNADALLRAASRTVDELLRGVMYDVDSDELPTDTDVAQSMQDATVAIVHELVATGVLESGGTAEWDSVGIGNVKLSGRKVAEGTRVVAGIPVPPIVLVYLSDVGRPGVWVR